MKTVRRLLYRDIVWSVVFVSLAFLSLFSFIDLVDELGSIGRNGYTLGTAVLHVLLAVPGHFYELFPIAVLIGTIYAMARLAQSSEFTILRTAGLGPGRALRLLALPGLVFAVLTFIVGDYVAPLADREAAAMVARVRGLAVSGSGAWLKAKRSGPDGERNISVHVAAVAQDGALGDVRIFELDGDGRLRRRIEAQRAQAGNDGIWQLQQVQQTDWPTPAAAVEGQPVRRINRDTLAWPSNLAAGVVATALLPSQTMSTVALWRYASHLAGQDQAVERHQIQFWKKALYPLACVVMVALALPFAYLHARAGGISFKVFGGIMLGISFVLLNNASGHLGLLNHWTPWVAAAAPSLIYLMLSMAAFGWLVRYR